MSNMTTAADATLATTVEQADGLPPDARTHPINPGAA